MIVQAKALSVLISSSSINDGGEIILYYMVAATK